jgi:cobyrinic acid a,c-diamide synthase
MTITKKIAASKIAAYLQHELSLADLVDWAENAMQEGAFARKDAKVLADVIGRLGVADERAFVLTWEDCEDMLKRLGYSARVAVIAS